LTKDVNYGAVFPEEDDGVKYGCLFSVPEVVPGQIRGMSYLSPLVVVVLDSHCPSLDDELHTYYFTD
jgi:hypothetical protein